MENRKIILVDSATNSKVTLTTNCTTFGELKELARQAGVNYSGKDWLEGLTKTAPTSDDSLLPTNVNYHGTVTNNLVYMLSNTNKKIKSGVDRRELYILVKQYGIANSLKQKYGKNFTNLKTDVLAAAVSAYADKLLGAPVHEDITGNESAVDYKSKYEALVYGIACLLSVIDSDTANDIQKQYDAIIAEEENEEVNSPSDIEFSDAELKAMFKK